MNLPSLVELNPRRYVHQIAKSPNSTEEKDGQAHGAEQLNTAAGDVGDSEMQ